MIVVGPTPPELHLAADLERKVDEAVLEILDPREIGEPAAVSNRHTHDRKILDCHQVWNAADHLDKPAARQCLMARFRRTVDLACEMADRPVCSKL